MERGGQEFSPVSVEDRSQGDRGSGGEYRRQGGHLTGPQGEVGADGELGPLFQSKQPNDHSERTSVVVSSPIVNERRGIGPDQRPPAPANTDADDIGDLEP